ncbi:MAG: helix-turn-helix domain-containing protein [Limnochordia bacterium]|jgi:AraC-like DNA-binding protein
MTVYNLTKRSQCRASFQSAATMRYVGRATNKIGKRRVVFPLADQYTAYDFISANLVITEIRSVYWNEMTIWKRPTPIPRKANGLVLVTSGRIDYVFGGVNVTGEKGDVLFFPKGIPYSGTKYGDVPNSFFVMDFQTLHDDDCVNFPLPLSFRAVKYSRIEDAFRRVLSKWSSQDIASRLKCQAEAYTLLSIVIEDYSKAGADRTSLELFSKISEYLGRNYTDPQLTVKKICKEFYISESQLRRIFHTSVGQSPLAYIHSMRLNLAKSMLSCENGDIPVEAVAYSCGFNSLSYFSRFFKMRTGCSPGEYRRRQH